MLADLDSILLPGITHWNHPRFFAYFGITASEPGILAELLIAALNQNAMLWRTSPAATELEQVTLGWLADLLGLPASWNGHIEDGASTSTLAALATARHVAPEGRTVVYCSEHAHSSVDKACRLLGLEVRKVASDAEFRMRAELLDLSDAVAVVATVGTTSTTSVDPVPAIADLCEAAGVWLHIDASYAGSAAVCEEHRWALAGCERADSLVVNPHKWMFTPIDCSALFTSRPDDLRDAFSLVPEYLRTSDEDVINLMDYGPGARPPLPRAQAVGRAPRVRARRACSTRSASTCGWRRSSSAGSSSPTAGSSSRRGRSRSSASAGSARTS